MDDLSLAPRCGECGQTARLARGADVHPHRPALAGAWFWRCDACGARVGCHAGTTRALGTPAGQELRRARKALHEEVIDPLWRGFFHGQGARDRAYRFLADRMGLDDQACHVGQFNLEQCEAARAALEGVTYDQIKTWALTREPRRKREPNNHRRTQR